MASSFSKDDEGLHVCIVKSLARRKFSFFLRDDLDILGNAQDEYFRTKSVALLDDIPKYFEKQFFRIIMWICPWMRGVSSTLLHFSARVFHWL